MNFLCPNHRQNLRRRPGQAKDYWNQWMHRGAQARLERRWRDAVVYSGCSFELADDMLAAPELVVPDASLFAIDRYFMAGQQLAHCLADTGQHDIELHVLLQVHQQLMTTCQSGRYRFYSLADHLSLSLQRLHRFSERHGHFNGYRDCCEETAAMMSRPAM